MSFPTYAHYKDSGVEWLGEVPAHWSVTPFKWQIAKNDGGVWGDDPDGTDDTFVLRSTEQTVDGRWKLDDPALRKLSKGEKEACLLAVGDLVVTKSSGSSLHIGKTTIVTPDIAEIGCCYSNFMQRIRVASSFDARLAWYIMNNEVARLQFDLASNSTTGLANLNGTMIGQILVTVPPPSEQAGITNFLDRETTKLDALITEQRTLIDLLKEKRQAVISHAVTKGLDPRVPMKDSGVEWLGEVPAHWAIVRLASIFQQVAEDGVEDLPILSVSIHSGVSDKEMNEHEMDRNVTRSDDRSKYKRVLPGDLVYNMMRAWQGGFGSVTVEGMVSPAYVVARPICEFVTEFIEQQLRTPNAVEEMRRHSQGVTDFRLRLYWEEFKTLQVVLPSIETQREIIGVMNEKTEHFDALTAEAQTTIALLQERRSALISAAVTGKIDVRQHATEAA